MKQSKLYRAVSTKGLALQPGVSAQPVWVRYLWQVHVQSCLRREIECSITIAQFAEAIIAPCAYCGAVRANQVKHPRHSEHWYNGIDRAVNTIGYVTGNIVTACKLCNSMKSSLSHDEFVTHVRRITDHQCL